MRVHTAGTAVLSLILVAPGFAQIRPGIVKQPGRGPTVTRPPIGMRGVMGERGLYGFWYPPDYAKLMHLFGYHSIEEPTRESLTDATKDFQHDHGLPVNGDVDEDTEEVLRSLHRQLEVRLQSVGFRSESEELPFGIPDPGRILDLSPALRVYESMVGLPKTGIYRGAVKESLRRDAAVSAALRAESLQMLPFGRVLLASQHSGSSRSYLLGHGDDIEAWHFDKGEVTWRMRGPDAVYDLDADVSPAFESAVPNAFVVQVLPHAADTVSAIFVNGQGFAMDVQSLVSGKKGWQGLEGVIALAKKQGWRPLVFIHRSTIAQAGLSAGRLAPYLGKANIEIPDTLELAVALQLRYGAGADFFLVNEVDRAIQNVKELPQVEAGSQIRVYVDKKGFQDFRTVDHLRPSLKHAHIEAVRVGEVQPGTPKIALIIGHNTPDARALLSDLGRDGHFKGSIVALAVCGQGGEVPFNTKLILESGARGVLFYDQRIKQVAVERALYQLCELVQKEGLTNGNIQALFRLAVDRALKDADLTDAERADLRLLHGSVLQLSNL